MTKPAITIGVFDSGVGGLTVLRELAARIPHANYLYFGDTARLPYGSKSAETVARYAVGAAHFLHQQGADLLVIACNTATALALPQIRAALPIPVEGVIEPGADAAAAASSAQQVVVVATQATVASHAYRRELEARGCAAHEKACPLLVPLVEEGWTDHNVTRQVAQIYLDEAFAGAFAAADVLLLGCTHYPLLRPLLRSITPKSVTIVDSAESTAKAVAAHLAQSANCPPQPAPAHQQEAALQAAERAPSPLLQFYATDSAEKFKALGSRFLGYAIAHVEHVDLKE